MANQDLTAMITELYNHVGGEMGYNNYCHVLGMLETIKAKLSWEVFGNVPAENVGVEQGNLQEQQLAQNVVMGQGIAQQPPPPAPAQNVVPPAQVPVVDLDALGAALSDDWRPYDGQTFDFISPAPIFWFNKILSKYMITSCRIRIRRNDMRRFRQGSPPHSFVYSINWRDRSIPATLHSSRLPAPPTPGLIFSQAEPNLFFLYWLGVNKYFGQGERISVSYQWKRSRNNGRLLLMVTIEEDSSHAIGGASGSAGPQDRGETSAAGASRARHGTTPHRPSGNQLSSSRVLRSATRGQT